MSFISKLKVTFNSKFRESKKFSPVEKEIFNGNYIIAKELLDGLEKGGNFSERDKLKSKVLKAYILENLGDPKQSLEILQGNIDGYSNTENFLLLYDSYIAKAYCLFDLGNLTDSKDSIDKGLELVNSFPIRNKETSNEIYGKIHFLKSKILTKEGNFKESINEMNKSLTFRKYSENYEGLADIYAELGKLYSGLL